MIRSFTRQLSAHATRLLVATALSLAPATQAQSPQPGRIFSSTGADWGGLFAFNPDGSNGVMWTANTFDSGPCGDEDRSKSTYPTVASNGTIAFMSSRDEIASNQPSYRVEIMNPDGTGRHALTTRAGAVLSDGTVVGDLYPAISPDGTKVAFVSRRNDVWVPSCSCYAFLISSIFIVNTDGTGLHQVTFPQVDPSTGATNGLVYSLAWNPDSTKLAFRAYRLSTMPPDMNLHFHMLVGIIDATGSNETVVAPLPSTGQSYGIDWSPDGRYLVADYGLEADGAPPRELIIFDLQGGTSTGLLASAIGLIGGGPGTVRFSPDSQRLIFAHGATLATMNTNGTDIVALNNVPVASGEPVWWMPGPSIPTPARLELEPNPVTLLTGGATVTVTPTLYDAQSNVIVKVATGWTTDFCNGGAPRYDSTGVLTPGTYPWYYTCNFSASNGGQTGTVTVINNPSAGDLGLAVLPLPGAVIVSNSLTYSVTITNHGPIDVSDVSLTDQLPTGATLVSAPTNCTLYGTTVYCDIASLAAASATNVTIVVEPTLTGLLTNIATVTATVPDSDLSDNTATNVTTSSPLPVNQPPVPVCQNVTTNADGDCHAEVPVSAVDNGSFDPDGTIVSRSLTPAGPYPVGATKVTLTVVDDEGASNSCLATITVVTNQPDLWTTGELTGMTCTNAVRARKRICQLGGRLDLMNHRAAYASSDLALVSTCRTTTRSINCKLTGTLSLNQMNVSCTPVSTLSLYLSVNPSFDAGDVLMQRLKMKSFAKSFAKGKPIKINARVPKGVDLAGKYVIVVLNDTAQIIEANQTDIAASFGPLP